MGRRVGVVCTMGVLPMAGLCAQGPAIAAPERWEVSPDNDRAPGEAGYRIVHEASGVELVFVPAGSFVMGSEEGEVDERPAHEVELNAFWIGRTEVTVGQWIAVMGKVDFEPPNDQGNDHPIVAVAWERCKEFAGKLGLRLPTEAEWEYAAAGPESRKYPWGNEFDESRLQWALNRHPLGAERTAAAGSYPEGASWCGALDMVGNVWEWCADWYDEMYYTQSPRVNPTGPAEVRPICLGQNDGSKHWFGGPRIVIRGGCFASDDPLYLRCQVRNNDPSLWHFALGFRVARRAE